MSFIQADDDDTDFLAVGGSSKLVNLFTEPNLERSTNLKYSAPKQPRTAVPDPQSSAVSMSALYITVVHGFKFDGNKPLPQGKLGAAILGNHSVRSYKLLLYKGKQQPVAIAAIGPRFSFKVVANNYANFQDEQQANWSVLFDSLSVVEEFSKQVGLARANCITPSESSGPLVQLLVPGDGPELEPGDGVQILYTSYILTENTFGRMLESNQNVSKPTKLLLGKGKFIKGLEDGLIGAKKNSKILIIVPPLLGYGSESPYATVTSETILLYEVFISKTKSGREAHSPTPSLDFRETKSSSFSIPPLNTITAEPATEQPILDEPSRKASLIERMAKMGRPLFPGAGTVSPKFGDEAKLHSNTDSEEEPSTSKGSPLLNAVRRRRTLSGASDPTESSQKVPSYPPETQSSVSYHPQSYPVPFITPPPSIMQPHPYTPNYNPSMMVYPSYTPMPSIESQLPLLVTETRTQNTEVRILLGKLEDKIEYLSRKIENKYEKSPSSLDPKFQQSIERILEENNRLQGNNVENLQTLNSLNSKISEILDKSSKEESSPTVDHTKLKALETEKNILTRQLKETVDRMIKYQGELEESQLQLSRVQEQLQKGHAQVVETTELEEALKEASKEKQALQTQVESLKESITSIAGDKDLLEKNLGDKNQQLEKERREAADKLEGATIAHKKEMEELTFKLKELNEGRSTLAQTEEELKEFWQDKLEQAVKENQAAYEKNMHQLLEEKIELNLEIRRLKEQLNQPPKEDQTVKEVEEQWKIKLELLEAEHSLYKLDTKAQIERLSSEINDSDSVKSISDISVELKRLVNAVYRNLQNDINEEQSYQGIEILQLVLDTFRGVTLEFLSSYQNKQSKSAPPPSSTELEEDSNLQNNETEKESEKENSETPQETKLTSISEIREEEQGDSKLAPYQDEDPVPNSVKSDDTRPQEVEEEETPSTATVEVTPGSPAQFKIEKNKSSDSLTWKPQPPPPPLFDEDDDEDDWLK